MKANDLREKNAAELNEELKALKQQLFNLRFQHATNQLDNPLQLRQVKRSIARVKTVLREEELQAKKAN